MADLAKGFIGGEPPPAGLGPHGIGIRRFHRLARPAADEDGRAVCRPLKGLEIRKIVDSPNVQINGLAVGVTVLGVLESTEAVARSLVLNTVWVMMNASVPPSFR